MGRYGIAGNDFSETELVSKGYFKQKSTSSRPLSAPKPYERPSSQKSFLMRMKEAVYEKIPWNYLGYAKNLPQSSETLENQNSQSFSPTGDFDSSDAANDGGSTNTSQNYSLGSLGHVASFPLTVDKTVNFSTSPPSFSPVKESTPVHMDSEEKPHVADSETSLQPNFNGNSLKKISQAEYRKFTSLLADLVEPDDSGNHPNNSSHLQPHKSSTENFSSVKPYDASSSSMAQISSTPSQFQRKPTQPTPTLN
eukprot:Sdes_comp19062_c0_seq1m9654